MATQPTRLAGRHRANAPASLGGWSQITHIALFVLFLMCATSWLLRLLAMPVVERWRWAEALLPVAAVATTLAALARRLPAQNILLAASLIALIGGAVQTLGATTGIPFGAYTYTDKIGQQIFDLLPWPMPCLWVVVILNARGIARLVLRPWRKTRNYGFQVIGLTCILAVVFDLALEPFASKVSRYWIWQTPENVLAWHTAPWANFLGWLMTTLLILVVVTPWLINKKPTRRPPDLYPLIVWWGLNLIPAIGAAMHGLWSAAVFAVLANLLVTVFAVRGARW